MRGPSETGIGQGRPESPHTTHHTITHLLLLQRRRWRQTLLPIPVTLPLLLLRRLLPLLGPLPLTTTLTLPNPNPHGLLADHGHEHPQQLLEAAHVGQGRAGGQHGPHERDGHGLAVPPGEELEQRSEVLQLKHLLFFWGVGVCFLVGWLGWGGVCVWMCGCVGVEIQRGRTNTSKQEF